MHFPWKCVLVWASLCLNLQIQVLYKISRKSINTFWNILCKWDCKLFGIKFKVAFKKCGTSLGALWWKVCDPMKHNMEPKTSKQIRALWSPLQGNDMFWLLLSAPTTYYYLFVYLSSLRIYTHTICPAFADKSERRGGEGEMRGVGEASPSLPLPFTLHMKPFESHRIEFHRGRSRPFEAIEAIWGHSHPGSEASNPERPHRILQNPERPHLISKGVKFHKQAHWPLE